MVNPTCYFEHLFYILWRILALVFGGHLKSCWNIVGLFTCTALEIKVETLDL
jgi:hypothetical protein